MVTIAFPLISESIKVLVTLGKVANPFFNTVNAFDLAVSPVPLPKLINLSVGTNSVVENGV